MLQGHVSMMQVPAKSQRTNMNVNDNKVFCVFPCTLNTTLFLLDMHGQF